MDPSFDLPDSTDWLATPLSLLAPFESSLRCQVCKDFFDNPVITSCSHTFCSLCIRRCLSAEGKCPACRSSDQELKLRRNWAVQELVDAFMTARPSVLDLARKETVRLSQGEADTGKPAQKKRKVDHFDSEEAQVPGTSSQGRRTRSQGLNSSAEQRAAPQVMPEIVEDSHDDEEYVPDGLVSCPICYRKMKEEAVFPHLSVHEREEEPAFQTPTKPTSFGSLQVPSQRGFTVTNKQPERLPAINYSILKDMSLRKKLRDLGIPDWGPRQLLQRRHTEWMNLWNANCDSKNPKSKRILLQELDIWERTQGGHAAMPSAFGSSNNVMRKDFNANEWSTSHDDDFRRLIANARQKSETEVRSTIPGASVSSSEPAEPQAPQPAQQRPAQQQPAHQQPAHQQPAHQQPAHQQPAQQQSARQQLAQQQLAQHYAHQQYAQQQYAQQQPAQQHPAQQQPAQQQPAQQQPAQQQPAQQQPAHQQYAQQEPAHQQSAQQRPAQQQPAHQQPAHQQPAQQQPAQLPVNGAHVQLQPGIDANHVIDLS